MADEKAIKERAYHIWENEGRPHGRDREHWERASREIEAEAKKRPRKATTVARTKPAGKAKAKSVKAAAK
jgi:hypothetical protein